VFRFISCMCKRATGDQNVIHKALSPGEHVLSHWKTSFKVKIIDTSWISNIVATPVAENATTVSNKTMSDDVTMWHNRLAHVNLLM
jgi:hypothetical protein